MREDPNDNGVPAVKDLQLATRTNRTKRTPAERTIKAKARRLLALKDQTSEAYAEIDELTDWLIKAVAVGDEIDLGRDGAMVIVDKFIDRQGQPTNKVFKSSPVSRFEPTFTRRRKPSKAKRASKTDKRAKGGVA